MQGTRITGKGLAAIATLPELRRLNLWKAQGVDDAATLALVEMDKLESLVLVETGVTATGLMQLSKHAGLKNLYLSATSLSREQVDLLREAMPGCRISWWEKPAIEYPATGRRSGN